MNIATHKLNIFLNQKKENKLIIHGLYGVGKTYFINKYFENSEYNLIKFDASTKKSMNYIKGEITKSVNYCMFMKFIVIIDECEAFFNEKMNIFDIDIKNFKYIFICETNCYIKHKDKYNFKHKIEYINNEAEIIEILSNELGIGEMNVKESLKNYVGSDVRQMIYNLKYKFSGDIDKLSDDIYKSFDTILQNRDNFKLICQVSSIDIFSIPPMFHENYLSCIKKNKLYDVSYDICLGDIIHTYMYKNNEWNLIDYVTYLSIIKPLQNLNKFKGKIKFGSIINKILNKQSRVKLTNKLCDTYECFSDIDLMYQYQSKYDKNLNKFFTYVENKNQSTL